MHSIRVGVVTGFDSEFHYRLLASIKAFPNWPGPVSFRRIGPLQRAKQWPAITRWKPDGVICVLDDTESAAFLRSQTRVVNIEWSRDGKTSPDIGLDCRAMARQAVDYLLGLGYSTIAYFGWGEEYYRQPLAEATTCAGLRSASFEMDLRWPVPPAVSVWENKDEQIVAWLKRLPKPAAVVCVRDNDAAEISDHCADIGLPVPEEVGILGIGNRVAMCSLSRPHLSSIHVPAEAIGHAAAQRLSALLSGAPPQAGPLLLPPLGIIERESTMRTGAMDPTMREALRFLRDNATRGITVKEITQHLGISRTNLDVRLKRVLGKPTGAALRAFRLEAAKRMLTETDLPIQEVALRCGYDTPQYLVKAFRRGMKMSPGDYRRVNKTLGP